MNIGRAIVIYKHSFLSMERKMAAIGRGCGCGACFYAYARMFTMHVKSAILSAASSIWFVIVIIQQKRTTHLRALAQHMSIRMRDVRNASNATHIHMHTHMFMARFNFAYINTTTAITIK